MMNYGVLDSGVAINQLSYERNRRTHGQRYVGRKNMMNSFKDNFSQFKTITLTINRESIDPTNNSVDFTIQEFEDGYIGSYHSYTLVLEARHIVE